MLRLILDTNIFVNVDGNFIEMQILFTITTKSFDVVMVRVD